mgnify:CR=1 FL=1
MCRSIKRLRPAAGSDDPPATPEDIEAAARQFVRKVSGYRAPSRRNACGAIAESAPFRAYVFALFSGSL